MAGDVPEMPGNGGMKKLFPMCPEVCPMHSTMEQLVEVARSTAVGAKMEAKASTSASKESVAALDRARNSYLEEMQKISAQSKTIIGELVVAVKDLKKSVARLTKVRKKH